MRCSRSAFYRIEVLRERIGTDYSTLGSHGSRSAKLTNRSGVSRVTPSSHAYAVNRSRLETGNDIRIRLYRISHIRPLLIGFLLVLNHPVLLRTDSLPCYLHRISRCAICRSNDINRLQAIRNLMYGNIIQEDSTTTIVSICKELDHDSVTRIGIQTNRHRREVTRVGIAGSGRGLTIGGSQSIPRHASVNRYLHRHVAAVSGMRVVEGQLAIYTGRQLNKRRVDKRCTRRYIVVIHTRHLVATIRINTPNIPRISIKSRGRRSRVVPVCRNCFRCHIFKINRPRNLLRQTEGSEVTRENLTLAFATGLTQEECIVGLRRQGIDSQRMSATAFERSRN